MIDATRTSLNALGENERDMLKPMPRAREPVKADRAPPATQL
jgi:hypothetical protein